MRGRKGVAAGVSVAMLVPVVTLTAVLLLGTMMQAELHQRAAANAANLRAEEGKKYLRASILRGASNESLVNLYAAGKLPIDVDYLLAIDHNGTVLAERNEVILSLNPGDNVTLTPGQLDPRLSVYDGDFWRMKREVRELILHTSDGNTYHLSWGPWGGFMAATYSTNTATTSTATTRTTTTFTVTVSVRQTVYAPSTTTYTYLIRPRTFMTEPFMYVSASCTAEASYIRYSSDWTEWSDLRVSCDVSVSGSGPPYSYSLSANYCSSSGSSSSNRFSIGCSSDGTVEFIRSDRLTIPVSITVTSNYQISRSGSCTLIATIWYGQGTTSCSMSLG